MDRVFSVEQNPFTKIRRVAVAIRAVHENQRHIGMLHQQSDSNQVLMLHLAWHHKLRNEPPDQSFLWVDPMIHPRRLVQVAAVCRKVWRANHAESIPYAFSPPNDCFDEQTGKFLFGPTRLGLTCAAFVLAVFHVAGLPLINYASWPVDRPGDREWQKGMLALLEKTGAASEHVSAVRNEVGSVRYRPEEVAGAATVSPLPANFAIASELGQQILIRIQGN